MQPEFLLRPVDEFLGNGELAAALCQRSERIILSPEYFIFLFGSAELVLKDDLIRPCER